MSRNSIENEINGTKKTQKIVKYKLKLVGNKQIFLKDLQCPLRKIVTDIWLQCQMSVEVLQIHRWIDNF